MNRIGLGHSDLSTLPDGKNTLHITGEDVDGNLQRIYYCPFGMERWLTLFGKMR